MKQLVMNSMANWYDRGESDQTRLSRILDIAHDLKVRIDFFFQFLPVRIRVIWEFYKLQALSLLLNHTSLQFAIDLACLASRREYLKLEKWLSDKFRDQGESFLTALIKFIKVSSKFSLV